MSSNSRVRMKGSKTSNQSLFQAKNWSLILIVLLCNGIQLLVLAYTPTVYYCSLLSVLVNSYYQYVGILFHRFVLRDLCLDTPQLSTMCSPCTVMKLSAIVVALLFYSVSASDHSNQGESVIAFQGQGKNMETIRSEEYLPKVIFSKFITEFLRGGNPYICE